MYSKISLPRSLCGATDGYQPIEKQYALMPKIIETFIRHRNPLVITTKSTLLLRDLDLLEKLNKVAPVDVRVSVSTIDEDIRANIEPFASPTMDRLQMLSEISRTRNRCWNSADADYSSSQTLAPGFCGIFF